MEDRHFADITRFLTEHRLRRDLLRRLVGGGLAALVGLPLSPHDLVARNTHRGKRRKRKKQQHNPRPFPFNQFGCLDIGQPCRGDSTLCCSGICEGGKLRKAKRDTSRCVGHDGDICQAGQSPEPVCGDTNVPCTTRNGSPGVCATTTGNAGYCFNITLANESCTRDTDCQDDVNPVAACMLCPSSEQTQCVGIVVF